MVIKTILFDFGGVIIKTPNTQWLKRRAGLFGLADHPEIVEILSNPNESQLVKDICLGNVSEDQVWVLLAEKWHLKPGLIAHIRQRLFSKRHLNKTMVKFIAELNEGYQTAILSNAGNQTRSVMENAYHLNDLVDDIIISAEEGVIKPDHQIFENAMSRLNASPETSLFLDDYVVNVLAARDFGMNAVQYINNHQAIQIMRDYLDEEG